jgi:nucleoside 2-deoxyribosyltransferase
MTYKESVPLLVGEIFVDYTLTTPGKENKLRLGGIVHAARGFWAFNAPFSVAAVLPSYLEDLAREYLLSLGCVSFHILGEVRGAPNLTVIHDATEVADQEYDTILRDDKFVKLSTLDLTNEIYRDILIFPGSYDLLDACKALPVAALLHVDVAYDLDDPALLAELAQTVQTILISTSSDLFRSISNGDVNALSRAFESCAPVTIILKENRGGSRIILDASMRIEALPAQLGSTINSVGVGDVFAAAYLASLEEGSVEAGWRATYAAAAYSQTTYPDLFKAYVQRDMKLDTAEMRQLGGVFLPWEKRREHPIYLAAPDFTYIDRRAIDKAIASLTYHNFVVRRPILENGEIPVDSNPTVLLNVYEADRNLIKDCALIFAVPTGRDPGTLVEIGIAIESSIPVVVYDPAHENNNTMVMAGAQHYSADLDSCLNAVFQLLSGAKQQ